MCPVCVSTAAALITAGVTSTGGIATLVVSRLRRNQQTNNEKRREQERGEKHG